MITLEPGLTPYAETHFARLIRDQISLRAGTQTIDEIAHSMGYQHSRFLQMMANGEVLVTFDQIPKIAEAFGADPEYLMRLAMAQWWPGLTGVIPEMFRRYLVTDNEANLVAAYREALDGDDYAVPEAVLAEIRELINRSRSEAPMS